MMHKFTFIFLAALVTLLGLSTAVQAVPADAPQTNGARFARGLPPLAPVKRTEVAKRLKPSSSSVKRMDVVKRLKPSATYSSYWSENTQGN